MVRAALAAIATLCALVPAGLAGAAPPAGVREAPKLEPAASWVAGKAVKVWCDPSLDEARGEEFALVGGDEFRLDMITCSLLHARLAGKSTPPALLAEALRILAHQAAHAGGIQDESETECWALQRVPGMANRFFGFKTWRSRHDLMTLAWQSHRGLPPDYTRLC